MYTHIHTMDTQHSRPLHPALPLSHLSLLQTHAYNPTHRYGSWTPPSSASARGQPTWPTFSSPSIWQGAGRRMRCVVAPHGLMMVDGDRNKTVRACAGGRAGAHALACSRVVPCVRLTTPQTHKQKTRHAVRRLFPQFLPRHHAGRCVTFIAHATCPKKKKRETPNPRPTPTRSSVSDLT